MRAGNTTVPLDSVPHLQDSFQQLLLEFSLAGSVGSSPQKLIQVFLRSTRNFFAVQGAYFWRRAAPDVLVAEEADSHRAEQFPGTRLQSENIAITREAVGSGRTLFRNA